MSSLLRNPVQLVLDLFAAPAGSGGSKEAHPVQRTDPEVERLSAQQGPMPVAEPLSQVFEPAIWHHPRANRMARLAGCDVAYEFKRAKRRTIGLTVGADGLCVRAPTWTPLGEVEAFLQQKANWVIDKLKEARARGEQARRQQIHWGDGGELDYLGERVVLRLDPAQTRAKAGAMLERGAEESSDPHVLWLGVSKTATVDQVRDVAQAWLMRQAQQLFAERLDHFAPQVGVRYERMRLSSASTRWGTASADGTIRLNWRLIHLSIEMIDYVVVHELSHLRHMDHSPQFWNVVASVMPDHQRRRQALKAKALNGEG